MRGTVLPSTASALPASLHPVHIAHRSASVLIRDGSDAGGDDDSDDDPRARATGEHSAGVVQRLHVYLRMRRYDEFRAELARAELAHEISEFYALSFQAILAVAEGEELAGEYLEMAEAVASSPYELAVVAESRAAYDLLQGNPFAAAERCLTALEHVHQTEGLWIKLLVALCRMGDTETIDATLSRFAELNDECTARLVGLLSSEPGLCDIHARPAFQQLLATTG